MTTKNLTSVWQEQEHHFALKQNRTQREFWQNYLAIQDMNKHKTATIETVNFGVYFKVICLTKLSADRSFWSITITLNFQATSKHQPCSWGRHTSRQWRIQVVHPIKHVMFARSLMGLKRCSVKQRTLKWSRQSGKETVALLSWSNILTVAVWTSENQKDSGDNSILFLDSSLMISMNKPWINLTRVPVIEI